MAVEKTIWLIGGTQESRLIATALSQQGWPSLVSVTTATAINLYAPSPSLTVWVGQLSPTDIDTFLHQHAIGRIVDASHPFAVQISELAIAAAQRHRIPYLRYLRPALPNPEDSVIIIRHYRDLFKQNLLDQQRVLLTVGYRALPEFGPWQSRATLFARILPSPVALETALGAGFSPGRLIALRPPITPALEAALWQQWQITWVVAKASGHAGGEQIKRDLAKALGIQLVLLARPSEKTMAKAAIRGYEITDDLTQVLAFCQAAQF